MYIFGLFLFIYKWPSYKSINVFCVFVCGLNSICLVTIQLNMVVGFFVVVVCSLNKKLLSICNSSSPWLCYV